jgi:ribosomal protection tetracycline resistance protein
VEGVQAQTRILMRALQRLHIPTLMFINKIDRGGAHTGRALQAIAERLTPAIIPMGSASELGTSGACYAPYGAADTDFTARLLDLLADHNDVLLARYLNDETTIPYRQLRGELAAQTRQALVHPVFFGSAITGVGVDSLIAGIKELLCPEGARRRSERLSFGHSIQDRARPGWGEDRLCSHVLRNSASAGSVAV